MPETPTKTVRLTVLLLFFVVSLLLPTYTWAEELLPFSQVLLQKRDDGVLYEDEKWLPIISRVGFSGLVGYGDQNGVPQDLQAAVQSISAAAAVRDHYATYNLGVLYLNGWGLAKDYEKAIKWFREASIPAAKYNLALMYENGLGVPRDDKIAMKLLIEAVINGHGPAVHYRGLKLESGFGVQKNEPFAVAEYLSAADGLEYAPSQFYIGLRYANGWYVPKEFKSALHWVTKAAAQGYAPAQHYLGLVYATGRGVPKNASLANLWEKLAAAPKKGDTPLNRDEAARLLSEALAASEMTNTIGSIGDQGPAISAVLSSPTSVIADKSGNLYISDQGNIRIRKVNAVDGTIITVAGNGTVGSNRDGGAATSMSLNNLWDIALDSMGNIFIAELDSNRIRKVDVSNGTISTVAGNGAKGYAGDGGPAVMASLYYPNRVFVDSSDNIFISDQGNHRIRKVNASDGTISTVAGNGKVGYGGDGEVATLATLGSPSGIFVDSSGNIFIAERTNHRIRKVNVSDGTINTVAGNGKAGYAGDGGAATAASLYEPSDIFVDSSGNLFIADTRNHSIRKVNSSDRIISTVNGTMSTVAGVSASGYIGESESAISGRLLLPSDVFVDSSGNIFIADTRHNCIRKISQ